jgi:hypothetical protein
MPNSRRIKVKGVRKRELSTEDLAFIYYQLGKSELRRKRQDKIREKAKRRERVN